MKKMNNMLEKGISLKDAIHAIQDELIKCQEERQEQKKPPLFETERLVLEANCVFSNSKDVNGGVDLKLIPALALDAEGNYHTETSIVQKITIEFKTVSSYGKSPEISFMENADGRYPKKNQSQGTVLHSVNKGDVGDGV